MTTINIRRRPGWRGTLHLDLTGAILGANETSGSPVGNTCTTSVFYQLL